MKYDITKFLDATRPSLSSEARAGLWARVEKDISQPTRSPYMAWVRAHVPALTAVFLVVISGGTATALAEHARPGDMLFPIDRAMERLEVKFARSEEKRTRLGVAHAEERISELRELIGTSSSRVEITATSSDAHVSATVHALVSVMTESKMSSSDRERIYEDLFQEIDPLSIEVRVNATSNGRAERDHIRIERDERGESRLEIRDAEKRTRIERKDGEVRIVYDESDRSIERSDVRSVEDNDERRRGRRDD
jgi:hypothetical protein